MDCAVCGQTSTGSPCHGCRFWEPCSAPVKGFALCGKHRKDYDSDTMPIDVLEKIFLGASAALGLSSGPATSPA